MIAYVKGILDSIEADAVLVDVNGVGFRVYTPISEQLLRVGVGSEIKLHTYMNVREDAMILYGFLDTDTLDLFEKLISVNGVGPKMALQVLSSVTATELILAIARDDKKVLTGISGIGAKTAARIILDLKDKVNADSITSESGVDEVPAAMVSKENSAAMDAIMALCSLGYTRSEAEKVVASVGPTDGLTTEDILRLSLKMLY